MIKQDLRLFFSSFFITLLCCGWLAAFIAVDTGSTQYQSLEIQPAFSVTRRSELKLDVSLLGHDFSLTLEPLNRAETVRKQYACLLTPRAILRTEQLYALCVYGGKKLYAAYREYEYQQNVLKSQQFTPEG